MHCGSKPIKPFLKLLVVSYKLCQMPPQLSTFDPGMPKIVLKSCMLMNIIIPLYIYMSITEPFNSLYFHWITDFGSWKLIFHYKSQVSSSNEGSMV